MSRVQLALNVDDLDAGGRVLREALRRGAGQEPPGYANFALAEPAAQARAAGEPRPGRHPEPPRRRGRVDR